MAEYDYLIIGGGIAGTTAAETIRAEDPQGSIAIVSDEPHALYSRVLMPNYIKGLIRREQVFLRAPGAYAAKNIATFFGRRAAKLDIEGRTVALENGEAVGYQKLLIAGGGKPVPIDIPGENLPEVLRFQTIDDADAIAALASRAKRAVVVGGSFIAFEYLDILARKGIPTALVMREKYFFGRFVDAAGGEFFSENLKRRGIGPIVAGDALVSIEGSKSVRAIRTQSGQEIECDMVCLGVGLRRASDWLENSGLAADREGVTTNEFLETSTTGIFAAGDIAHFFNPAKNTHETRGNWANAFLQGRTAGHNMVRPDTRAPFESISDYGTKNLDLALHVIGDTTARPGTIAISRRDPNRNTYEYFVFRDRILVGVALINRTEDHRIATALIRGRVPISVPFERFSAFDLELSTLLPEVATPKPGMVG